MKPPTLTRKPAVPDVRSLQGNVGLRQLQTALDALRKRLEELEVYASWMGGVAVGVQQLVINTGGSNISIDTSQLATKAQQLPDNHDVNVSNQPSDYPLPAAQVTALLPQTNALTRAQLDAAPVAVNTGLAQGIQQGGTVLTDDSSEREYSPGLTPLLVTVAGDTTVYTPPAGKAWLLHFAYAVPVTRGVEDAPVITIKTVSAASVLIATHYIAAAVSKRKKIAMPVDARLVVNLDIAGRVPTNFDIELLP